MTTTIEEAQNELHDVLVNQFGERIPDDKANWDLDDWTVFALEFLMANIDDAVDWKEDETCETLWSRLGDVPVNDDGEIEIPYLHFEIGTDREEIWHWFEDTFDVSIYDLMFPNKENN